MVAILLTFAVTGCTPRTSIVKINQTDREVTIRVPPPDTENYGAFEAVTVGFLGGFTPQGMIMGGPVAGALGGALYAYNEPCHTALRDVVDPAQKLQSIAGAIDVSKFSEQLRIVVQQYHEMELSKKFGYGGALYVDKWRHFILDVDEIVVGLRTRVGANSSCNPGVYVVAFYRLTKVDDSSKSYKVLNSCSGAFSNQSLQEWFAEPTKATEEIRLLLKLLAENIAAETITGPDSSVCLG